MSWFLQSLVSFFATTILINGPIIKPPASYIYQSSSIDGSDSSSYTFSSMGIGNAVDRQYVVAVVCAKDSANSMSINSVTIGGAAATEIANYEADSATRSLVVGFYYREISSGTTTNIVLNLNQAAVRAGCSVYTIKNIESMTPQDTGSDLIYGSTAVDLTLDTPSGISVVLATAFNGGDTNSWSGLNEDYDAVVDTWSSLTSASSGFTSSGTKTITVTPVASDDNIGLSICLQ